MRTSGDQQGRDPQDRDPQDRDQDPGSVEPVSAWPVRTMPEVRAGDDLAGLLVTAMAASGLALRDGDVLVVSSKVVSKALGLRRLSSRGEAVEEQAVREVARRRGPAGDTLVAHSRSGPVMAAAGVDASNVPADQVLVLPEDPDAVARDLRARIADLAHGVVFGLVVADSAGRPWRDGVSDFALGAAGIRPLEDLRGRRDAHGSILEVTVRAIADEIAAAADLVKGKLDGIPAAVVSGVGVHVTEDDGPGAASLLRGQDGAWWEDWFRYGHVEAVRAALRSGQREPSEPLPPPATGPETVAVRANRALQIAVCATSGQVVGSVTEAMGEVALELRGGSAYAMGATIARLHVALWSEHLATSTAYDEEMPARFTIRELVD